MSGPPPIADIVRLHAQVGFVPISEVAQRMRPQEKRSHPKAALNSNLIILNQAAINAGFDFRRFVMNPRPAKSRNITAHVEDSGTAVRATSSQICREDTRIWVQ